MTSTHRTSTIPPPLPPSQAAQRTTVGWTTVIASSAAAVPASASRGGGSGGSTSNKNDHKLVFVQHRRPSIGGSFGAQQAPSLSVGIASPLLQRELQSYTVPGSLDPVLHPPLSRQLMAHQAASNATTTLSSARRSSGDGASGRGGAAAVPPAMHLRHRHLAAVLRGVDGLPAVEMCNGETLSAWLKLQTSPSPSLTERIDALAQVTAAVAYVHSKGFAVGDIRPDTVMRHLITPGRCAYSEPPFNCAGDLVTAVGVSASPGGGGMVCAVCHDPSRPLCRVCSTCAYAVCAKCETFSGSIWRLVLEDVIVTGASPFTSTAALSSSHRRPLTYSTVERLARLRSLSATVAPAVPYLAPEVLEALCGEGQPALDLARNDVWALGCLGFELVVTGGKSWWSEVQRMSRCTDDHETIEYFELARPLLMLQSPQLQQSRALPSVPPPPALAMRALTASLCELRNRQDAATFARHVRRACSSASGSSWLPWPFASWRWLPWCCCVVFLMFCIFVAMTTRAGGPFLPNVVR